MISSIPLSIRSGPSDEISSIENCTTKPMNMSGRGPGRPSRETRQASSPASNYYSSRFPPDTVIIHEMIGESPRAETISAYIERFKHSPEMRRLATSIYGASKNSIPARSHLDTTADRMALHAALNTYRLKRTLLNYPDLIATFPNNECMNRAVEAHRRKYGDVLSTPERGQSYGLLGLSERNPDEIALIRRSIERLVSKEASEPERQRFFKNCLDDEEILEAVKQDLEDKVKSSGTARANNAAVALNDLIIQEFSRDDRHPGHNIGGRRTNRQQPDQFQHRR